MIDFKEYLSELGTQRFRSIIIRNESTEKLTNFAKKTSKKLGIKALDLRGYFQKNNKLTEKLDIFNVSDLEKKLKEQSDNEDVLIIYNIGFLLVTWRQEQVNKFYKLIDKKWNSYNRGMESKLVFCIKSSIELNDLKIIDTKGKSRIIPLTEIKMI